MIPAHLARIRHVCKKFGPESGIHMDTTECRDGQARGKVIAKKGTKQMPVVVKGHEKGNITVVGTIWMSDELLPPVYVLQQRAIECLKLSVSGT
jgi:hypothetical protein